MPGKESTAVASKSKIQNGMSSQMHYRAGFIEKSKIFLKISASNLQLLTYYIRSNQMNALLD